MYVTVNLTFEVGAAGRCVMPCRVAICKHTIWCLGVIILHSFETISSVESTRAQAVGQSLVNLENLVESVLEDLASVNEFTQVCACLCAQVAPFSNSVCL